MTSADNGDSESPAPTMRSCAQLCIDKLSKPAGSLSGGMLQTRHTGGAMGVALAENPPAGGTDQAARCLTGRDSGGGRGRNTAPQYLFDGRGIPAGSGGGFSR